MFVSTFGTCDGKLDSLKTLINAKNKWRRLAMKVSMRYGTYDEKRTVCGSESSPSGPDQSSLRTGRNRAMEVTGQMPGAPRDWLGR